MRVNVYAEEMTDRIEIIGKEIDGHLFTGLRFYLELPATVNGQQHQGPFMHRPGDDDSSAVTFWGKRDLRELLQKALAMLDRHYGGPDARAERVGSPSYAWKEKGGGCRGCGKALDPDNFGRIADGCPCNSPRGVNHGLVPIGTCTCIECDPNGTGSCRIEAKP